MAEKYDLLIKNAAIHTMDQDRRVLKRGSLGVRGDKIAMIRESDQTEADSAAQVIDAEGMILFPGLLIPIFTFSSRS